MSAGKVPERSAEPYRERMPEENLQWLQCLDEMRIKTIRHYIDHSEQLDTAELNIRRHFGLDMEKYGDWSTRVAG